MRFIVLIVCFVIVMFVWLLAMLGAVNLAPTYSPWLPWFAIAILAALFFAGGTPPKVT